MREWSIITSNNHPSNPQQPIHSLLSTSKKLWKSSCAVWRPSKKSCFESATGTSKDASGMGHECKRLDLAAIKHQTYSGIAENSLPQHPIFLCFVSQFLCVFLVEIKCFIGNSLYISDVHCPLSSAALPWRHGAMHFWPLFPAAALASQWDAEFYRSPLRRLGVVHGLTRGWDNFFSGLG